MKYRNVSNYVTLLLWSTDSFELTILRIIHDFLHLKCYMHIPITRRIRSIVDDSLVHCHRGCQLEPHHPIFFDFIFSSICFVFLFIDIIHNHFQSIWVTFHLLFVFSRFCIRFVIVVFPEYHLKDCKQ